MESKDFCLSFKHRDESLELEYKRNWILSKPKENRNILNTISAFLNTQGGTIVIGVTDRKRKIVGVSDNIEEVRKIKGDIETTILNCITPETWQSFVTLDTEKCGDKFLISIKVHKDNTKMYLSKQDNGLPLPYQRKKDKTVVMDSEWQQIKRSEMNNINYKTWDSFKTEFKYNENDFVTLKRFLSNKKQDRTINFNNKFFQSHYLISDENNLTNAGTLFSDYHFPHNSSVTMAKWRGLTKSKTQLDISNWSNIETKNNLIVLYERMMDFILNKSGAVYLKTEETSLTFPDYPEIAVREVVVNALAHRDYSKTSHTISVEMFDDRLEIISAGSYFGGERIQDLDFEQIGQRRRNIFLVDFLRILGLFEGAGSGIATILNEYKQYQLNNERKPSFSSSNDEFRVILPNLNYNNEITDEYRFVPKYKEIFENSKILQNSLSISAKKSFYNLTKEEKEQTIIEKISKNSRISIKKMSEELGVGVWILKKIIKELKEKNIIQFVGPYKKLGEWQVVKNK